MTGASTNDDDVTELLAGAGPSPSAVDYDLHGLVGIRLVGASVSDADAVSGQLGSIRSELSRDPDIVLQFVPRLSGSSDLQYLGLDDGGFDRRSFYVLQRERTQLRRARLAFDELGDRFEIVCESGLGHVPHLIAVVNLTMLAKGLVPVHGSAFTYDGTGALVTGWAKGGKTEILLGLVARGAKYVGDEWVYVDEGGRRMYGIPEPIRIWDWHLDHIDRYRHVIRRAPRAWMWSTRRVGALSRALPDRLASTASGRMAIRVLEAVERQAFVRIPPERLFGRERCALEGQLDKVFLAVSHDSPRVTVEPANPEEIADRIVFSHEYERLDLISRYLQSRFAFPDRASTLLEHARERERELLGRALAGKEAYTIRHPFPAPIPVLVEALLPFL